MNHSAMDASRKPRLRLTAVGSTSLPLPSSVARFHSGCSASSALFSSTSFGSLTVRNSTATATNMMAETMMNSGW